MIARCLIVCGLLCCLYAAVRFDMMETERNVWFSLDKNHSYTQSEIDTTVWFVYLTKKWEALNSFYFHHVALIKAHESLRNVYFRDRITISPKQHLTLFETNGGKNPNTNRSQIVL